MNVICPIFRQGYSVHVTNCTKMVKSPPTSKTHKKRKIKAFQIQQINNQQKKKLRSCVPPPRKTELSSAKSSIVTPPKKCVSNHKNLPNQFITVSSSTILINQLNLPEEAIQIIDVMCKYCHNNFHDSRSSQIKSM